MIFVCRLPGGKLPRVMLMGADVSHATLLPPDDVAEDVLKAAQARQDVQPSIGAVVATTNEWVERIKVHGHIGVTDSPDRNGP